MTDIDNPPSRWVDKSAILWIDVEDLFAYAYGHKRPSGIQRVAFELSRTLWAEYGDTGRVRFVRHDPTRGGFRCIEWESIAELFNEMTGSITTTAAAAKPPGISPHPNVRQFVRELMYRLPASLRIIVIEVLVTQEKAFRAWGGLIAAVVRGVIRIPHRLARRLRRRTAVAKGSGPSHSAQTGGAANIARGDTVLALGAPWSHPNYMALIAAQRTRNGARFALLVHDIVPLRHPEWCDQGTVRLFRSFFDGTLPLCDQVFADSRATAADVTAYAREQSINLPAPVISLPIGTGFGVSPPSTIVPRTGRLPAANEYVLFISTIEARKNHLLLFRVWDQLLRDLPPNLVPTLVFAGRTGWLVGDLMQQIDNTGNLNGKLLIIDKPTDAEVAALYQGCLFTVYPSFYEGWGLPVTESLAFGKPCLIADRTSLPEAGGSLVRKFDPDNLNDAYAEIRRIILDREDLARWEEQVRTTFRPTSWSTTAQALLAAL